MKVLFAVNDENISASIVKRYQKQYKEIISYKNVYYFNAVLTELQRNKTYDRIVIREDLEEFTSSSVEQRDKFIFDRLDNISDEASSATGADIPIILICSERRNKSEDILVKLFGIGIYNAVLGDDRRPEEVCKLIYKPRSKKEAKIYYKIDSENVTYEKESENDVSEMEMQSILRHFKRLGENESKYAESFRNIVSQYNEAQLRIIIAVLPNNVKDVLERTSAEYQKLVGKVSLNENKAKNTTKSKKNKKAAKGTSEELLNVDTPKVMSKPVVVPTTINETLYKKVDAKKKIDVDLSEIEDDEIEDDVQKILEKEPPKRKRGRPRKNPLPEEKSEVKETPKKRGRPKKNPIPEETVEEEEDDDVILPGFDIEDDDESNIDEKTTWNTQEEDDDDVIVPGFEEEEDDDEKDDDEVYDNRHYVDINENMQPAQQNYDNIFDGVQYESLLTGEKKVAIFVGTSKNGTSFIVNNIAQILSNMGINTAILDVTQNKNDYYIYTKNDEDLRRIAVNSMEKLTQERAEGIKVNNNLTVYTNLPNSNEVIKNSRPILETLVQNHTIILIDSDFYTPIEYFERAQEIYLVQSMDVLTIQPLTEFLRELKVKNILEESKIRIILNKLLKIRGVSAKSIIGGMSNYNDPEMSFMRELFDRNIVRTAAQIPFDEDVYAKYLESLIECEIKINGYPKEFKQKLNDLAAIVYPLLPNGTKKNKKASKGKYNSNNQYSNSFSSGMNSTLDNMRKRY